MGPRYNGSIHGKSGFLVLALATILAACDALGFFHRALTFFRSSDWRNYRLFWQTVVLNQANHSSPEYTRLVPEELEEHVPEDLQVPQETEKAYFIGNTPHRRSSTESDEWAQSSSSRRPFVNPHNRWQSMDSTHSEETLHSPHLPMHHDAHDRRRSILSRIGHVTFATAERTLVILAFKQLLTGFTVYSGICRDNYINGCLAHLISEFYSLAMQSPLKHAIQRAGYSGVTVSSPLGVISAHGLTLVGRGIVCPHVAPG